MRKIKIKRKKLVRNVPKGAVEIYDKLCAIKAAGDDRIPEPRGGRCNEYNRLSYQLCDLLGVDRWQGSPLDCRTEMPPGYIANDSWKLQNWQAGYQAFRLLERASRT
jgi:hypothetical protein